MVGHGNDDSFRGMIAQQARVADVTQQVLYDTTQHDRGQNDLVDLRSGANAVVSDRFFCGGFPGAARQLQGAH